jgi:hypothetical protein
MPVGTDILAMRAGLVVRVEESYYDGDHVPGHENHVNVQHEDGTVARYAHLTNLGALVQVGDLVQQGQPIGLSGDTGNSRAPTCTSISRAAVARCHPTTTGCPMEKRCHCRSAMPSRTPVVDYVTRCFTPRCPDPVSTFVDIPPESR